MSPFQWIAAPLCFLLAIVLLLRSARQASLFWKALLWAAIWLLGGMIILWPDITVHAARMAGVGRGTDLVLYLGALSGLFAFQRLYGRTRRLENIVTEIVRRQAIDSARHGDSGAPNP